MEAVATTDGTNTSSVCDAIKASSRFNTMYVTPKGLQRIGEVAPIACPRYSWFRARMSQQQQSFDASGRSHLHRLPNAVRHRPGRSSRGGGHRSLSYTRDESLSGRTACREEIREPSIKDFLEVPPYHPGNTPAPATSTEFKYER